jgi:hypothetical protein
VEVHHVDLGLGYEPDRWPAGLVERMLPDLLAGLPDRTGRAARRVLVREDHVRPGVELRSPGPQPLERGVDVGHRVVEQRAGRPPVQQQPHSPEVEEHQPRRVRGDRAGAEQLRVEAGRPVEVLGVLGDLDELHGAPPLVASLH